MLCFSNRSGSSPQSILCFRRKRGRMLHAYTLFFVSVFFPPLIAVVHIILRSISAVFASGFCRLAAVPGCILMTAVFGPVVHLILCVIFTTVILGHDSFSSCISIFFSRSICRKRFTSLVLQKYLHLFISLLQFLPICIIIILVKRIYPSTNFFYN